MKKIILSGCITTLFLFVGNVNAQKWAEVEKPTADDAHYSIETMMGAKFNNGLKWAGPALKFRYHIADNWAVRLQLAIGDGSGASMSEKRNFYEMDAGGALTGNEGTLVIKRSAMTLQLGGEYHMPVKAKKLDPYVALGVNYGWGKLNETGTNYLDEKLIPALSTQFPMEGQQPGYLQSFNYGIDGGYSFYGAQLGLGMDFYFVENVYLGMEVGLGMTTYNHRDANVNLDFILIGSEQKKDVVKEPRYKESYLGTQAVVRIGWRF